MNETLLQRHYKCTYVNAPQEMNSNFNMWGVRVLMYYKYPCQVNLPRVPCEATEKPHASRHLLK